MQHFDIKINRRNIILGQNTKESFFHPSIKTIIRKNNKIVLLYSRTFDYYEVSSGGIEKVKVRRQALIQKQMRRSACQLYQKVLVCLDAYAVSKKEICFFVYLGYFL